MQIGALYAAAGAFLGALVAIYVYHAAVVRPALTRSRQLLDIHDDLIAGGAASAAGRLGALEEADVSARADRQQLADLVTGLEALAETDLSRAGFVRYDAFAGSGKGL